MNNFFLTTTLSAASLLNWGGAGVLQKETANVYAKLSDNVVMLIQPDGSAGGSGSHVEIPGKGVFIMTNNHVCHSRKPYLSTKKGETQRYMIAKKTDGSISRVKILFATGGTPDICFLEASQPTGLKISESKLPVANQIVISAGHPILSTFSKTWGKAGPVEKFDIQDECAECKVKDSKDSRPVNKTGKVLPFFSGETSRKGFGKSCVTVQRGQQTGMVALPGSSGSPVVNGKGEVVGAIFAGDGAYAFAIIVPLDEVWKTIAEFTAQYP